MRHLRTHQLRPQALMYRKCPDTRPLSHAQVNLPELIFMMKEGEMIDERLCGTRDSKLAIAPAAPRAAAPPRRADADQETD